jgi:hypothetical protein
MKGGDKGGGEAGNKISIFFESSIYITTVSQFFLKTVVGLKIYPGQRKRKSHARAAPKQGRGGGLQAGRGLRGGALPLRMRLSPVQAVRERPP